MTLRVACLGAGYFSQFHMEAWTRNAGSELVGIADRDLSKAGGYGVPAFHSLDALLDQTRPDILDLIVPPPAHLSSILRALESPVKAVICQKPFCTSMEEAREATNAARRAGIPLIVHENFRFQPWYRCIRSALVDGRIGVPLQATFRLRPGDGQGQDAYLSRQPTFQTMKRFLVRETAVHLFDVFRFLFGEATSVYADLRQLNPAIAGEDAGVIVFSFADGVRAVFDGNRLVDHAATNTRCTMGEALIEGTEGVLTLQGDGSVSLRAFGSLDPTCLLAPTEHEGFGGDCVYALQEHVIRGLTEGLAFENVAEDYLKVVAMEHAAYRSAEGGCKVDLGQDV